MKNIEKAFKVYEEKNPHVYEEFEKNTLELVKAGISKTSAWLVVNKMRWDSMLRVDSTLDYKIPNDFIGVYSRRFMKNNPEYGCVFTVKATKADLESLV
jgi:hypothetical protein